MIVLYEKNETAFNTNGIGQLIDCTECVVTEELNGSFSLILKYPLNAALYPELKQSRIILTEPREGDEPQPFRILTVKKLMDNACEVYAEHIAFDLKGIPVKPFKATGVSAVLDGLKRNSMLEHAFTFQTDIVNAKSIYEQAEPMTLLSLLGGVQGSVLDVFGGEYEYNGTNVYLHAHRGRDNGVLIQYGKNLTGLELEETIESTYTGVLAYCTKDDMNIYGDVQYAENHQNYPRENIFILDKSSDYPETPTKEQLNQDAASYIKTNNVGIPASNYSIEFVPLWQTEEYKNVAMLERVGLGDIVTISYPTLQIDASAKVIKTEYDCITGRYKKIEIGNAKAKLGDVVNQKAEEAAEKKVKGVHSFLEDAINHATELITGGDGGNVVINRNEVGQPNEILIMDNPDKAKAKYVLRINMNGIGFSSSGYNGPFKSAWTLDGKFVADYIASGTINAIKIIGSQITGGTIKSPVMFFGDEADGVKAYYDPDYGLRFTGSKGRFVIDTDVFAIFKNGHKTNPLIQTTPDGAITIGNDAGNGFISIGPDGTVAIKGKQGSVIY